MLQLDGPSPEIEAMAPAGSAVLQLDGPGPGPVAMVGPGPIGPCCDNCCLMRDSARQEAQPRPFLMAALTISAIPSSINTYERLAVWAIQCCQSIANGQQVNVIDTAGQVPIAQCQVSVTADNQDRFILTAYVPVDREALNSSSSKTWMAAKDIAEATPHTNLLSN